MPHQCTACGHTFDDGSKEMLSGCPNCGGNKFQFRPGGTADEAPPTDAEPPNPPRPEDTSSVAETVGRATTKVRDFVSSDPTADPDAMWPSEADETDDSDIIDADARAMENGEFEVEDVAQERARSDVVSTSELSPPPVPDKPEDELPETDGRVVSEPTNDDPDVGVAELREQLNDQFESIKIVEPGQYELNLMELYDREEYIIALQENGRYVIQVPEQWIGDEPER
ncbi:MAG: OapC/ArvC family zinc-ribbon domain-containing protein [Natronomonas sp.]